MRKKKLSQKLHKLEKENKELKEIIKAAEKVNERILSSSLLYYTNELNEKLKNFKISEQ